MPQSDNPVKEIIVSAIAHRTWGNWIQEDVDEFQDLPSAVVEAAVDALATEFRTQESFTRQVVIEARGKIGGPKALEILMEAMVDPDASVRRKAEVALNR